MTSIADAADKWDSIAEKEGASLFSQVERKRADFVISQLSMEFHLAVYLGVEGKLSDASTADILTCIEDATTAISKLGGYIAADDAMGYGSRNGWPEESTECLTSLENAQERL